MNGIHVFRGWAVRQAAARLNKRTGCKSPRCRRCKCRGGLPLAKASHWSDLRRQTGRRPRHKSEDLRRQKEPLCPGNRVKWSVCDAEKRPRRCFMVLPRPFLSANTAPYVPLCAVVLGSAVRLPMDSLRDALPEKSIQPVVNSGSAVAIKIIRKEGQL